jgi:hypothetical protein
VIPTIGGITNRFIGFSLADNYRSSHELIVVEHLRQNMIVIVIVNLNAQKESPHLTIYSKSSYIFSQKLVRAILAYGAIRNLDL